MDERTGENAYGFATRIIRSQDCSDSISFIAFGRLAASNLQLRHVSNTYGKSRPGKESKRSSKNKELHGSAARDPSDDTVMELLCASCPKM